VAKRRRPNLNEAAQLLIRDVAQRLIAFSHLRPDRVLVVAGEARRASRASIKPLTFSGGKSRDRRGRQKPVVRLDGRRLLYCITLRPLFFRDSSAAERVETLLHELFHISPLFDGTLDPERRHKTLGKAFLRVLRPLVRRYLKECPHEVLQVFGHHGEVKVLQWLERPSARLTSGTRKVYDERHLFLSSVRMITRGAQNA
jgi:hypothetical protein